MRQSFLKVKKLIFSDRVLVHYDMTYRTKWDILDIYDKISFPSKFSFIYEQNIKKIQYKFSITLFIIILQNRDLQSSKLLLLQKFTKSCYKFTKNVIHKNTKI